MLYSTLAVAMAVLAIVALGGARAARGHERRRQ
jgi:hypothetical protein